MYRMEQNIASPSILCLLNLLHSERPKLHTILDFLSAIGLNQVFLLYFKFYFLFAFTKNWHMCLLYLYNY